VLKRVFELKDQIDEFMVRKENPVPQINEPERISDFGYLTDISLHLSDLNIRLQGKNQFIHNLHDQIKSFQKNFVYGKFSIKTITSHTFQSCYIARLLTLRNIAQPFLFSNLSSAQGSKIPSQMKHC
jgi:hypothetical protein